jgi:hypothetical protein
LPEIVEARGERLSLHMEPGLISSPESHVEFDPAIHDPDQIDHFSFEGLTMDEDQVRIIDRELPLYMNLALDETSRSGYSRLTSAKQKVARHLAQELKGIMEHDQDDAYSVSFQDEASRPSKSRLIDQVTAVAGRQQIPGKMSVITETDPALPIFLGDFSRQNFSSLDGALAVKINHILERRVPANAGLIGLGGGYELDTNNDRHLAAYNRVLEAKHLRTVSALQEVGAQVVAVVADPRREYGFDVNSTDQAIAQGVALLAKATAA